MHHFSIVILPVGISLEDKPTKIYDATNQLLWPYNAHDKEEQDVDEDESAEEKGSFDPWDWWEFGGRWNGEIKGQPTKPPGCLVSLIPFLNKGRDVRENTILAKDIPESANPISMITPDGKWHDQVLDFGDPFPLVEDPTDRWKQHVRETLAKYPNHVAAGVDIHT